MSEARTVTKDLVRRLAVVKQGLHQRPPKADKDALKRIIRQIGLLQLDSISVTARSHYLVMLSRAGLYNVDDLDALLPERYLFEQWAHVACMIPTEDFPYFVPTYMARRSRPRSGMGDDPQALMDMILDEIRQNGPMMSKDFESEHVHKGSWWDWKPSKVALEYLFSRGYLMVTDRQNFHRQYDLPERVLNGIAPDMEKSMDEYQRWAVITGLRYQGIATVSAIADYHRLRKTETRHHLKQLLKEGLVIPVTIEDVKEDAYLHAEDQTLLEQVAAGEHPAQVTTFLSPFDNLIWYRDRTEALFNFYYRIEVYTPAPKRRYGYYVLPILHNGKLIGRIDPKIERKERRFIIHALHLEPGVTVTNDLIAGLVGAIKEFMAFHDCDSLTLTHSTSGPLTRALLKQV